MEMSITTKNANATMTRGVDERTIGRSGLAKRQEVVGEAGEDDERASDPVKRQAERLENERKRENA